MKYSKNKRVSFDPGTHSYKNKDKKLISVTTLLNKFKNEFDSDFWSKKIGQNSVKNPQPMQKTNITENKPRSLTEVKASLS